MNLTVRICLVFFGGIYKMFSYIFISREQYAASNGNHHQRDDYQEILVYSTGKN